MSLINATCLIKVETQSGSEKKGTGFFISKKQILTCNHVVPDGLIKIEISNCNNQRNANSLTAKIIKQCALCDFALLEIIEDYQSDDVLELCESDIVEEESFEVFGYPDTQEGQLIGKKLIGKISRIVEDSSLSIHDIILNISDYSRSENYAAFSGSPLVNEYGYVIAILKYRDDQHLAAVSVKKAAIFLENCKIKLEPDHLNSFEHYKEGNFDSFLENIKCICDVEVENAINKKHPSKIVEELKGNIFYPNSKLSIKEIIVELRKRKNLNTNLWKGWIRLLTYIQVLKGDSTDINNIQINLTGVEFKSWFGLQLGKERKYNIPIRLNFYFTEEKSYFNIARKHLSSVILNQVTGGNSCSIFNSLYSDFNDTNFSNEDKRRIVCDIANPQNSGVKVPNSINISTLKIHELSVAIANSNTIDEACKNLEKIFINAIK